MKRKLIQHGLSSLTVSLPRKWVKEKNLKKGEEIEVEEKDRQLIISVKKHHEQKKIEIDISNARPMTRKMIGAAYKAGYDEVRINFSYYDELKEITELVREQFSGFEIVDQAKNSVIIKSISQTNFEEFGSVLKRFFFVLNNMASEFNEAIGKDDFEWMKNITLLKIESDKFADYCRRGINLGSEIDCKRIAPLYTIIEQLEKVADRYRDLCVHISANKIKVDNKIKLFLRKLLEFQKQFYELFYDFKLEKMPQFGRNKELLQKELDSCSGELKVIRLCDRILNLIFDLNGPLMTVYI